MAITIISKKKVLLSTFFFVTAFSVRAMLFAQISAKELLRQKTENEIWYIIQKSPAVTGLMAVDLTTGESFSFNSDIIFPQASAIKIPIIMEVYKQAHEGKFALTDSRTIKHANVVGGSGIIQEFVDPVSLSIRNLCILMISVSDNTATNSLIDLVSLPAINSTLKSLGMKDTRVQRRMMNPEASATGIENISTPAEAVAILGKLYKGEFIDKANSEEIISILKKTERQSSRLAVGIPNEIPIAFKPGVLNGVSTEWAIIFLPERPYAITLMESYKVNKKAENLMENLSGILYQYYWRMGNASAYGTYVDPDLIK